VTSSPLRGPRSDFTEDVINDIGNADPKDYPYASEFDQIDIVFHHQSWAEGALKFLDIVCLHTTATHSLARFNLKREDYYVQTFLERASFQWILHSQESADKEMMPLDTLFRSLKKYNGRKLSTEEVESLKAWLKQHATKPNSEGDTWAEDTNFKGNFHCEILLYLAPFIGSNPREICRISDTTTKRPTRILDPPQQGHHRPIIIQAQGIASVQEVLSSLLRAHAVYDPTTRKRHSLPWLALHMVSCHVTAVDPARSRPRSHCSCRS
jgi:hypothetical protein